MSSLNSIFSMFQFLIGTLKTLYFPVLRTHWDWFQFLIGTLKTFNKISIKFICIYVFQFLIGTLKTGNIYKKKAQESKVSIPYRHSKNNFPQFQKFSIQKTFQFLIGTLKTRHLSCFQKSLLLVSIPYRHSKNQGYWFRNRLLIG